MPVDIGNHLNQYASKLALRSPLGGLFGNPIWFSMVVIAVLLLIVYLVADTTPSVKLCLYLFGSTILLVLAHDTMVTNQLHEQYHTGSVDEIVGSINDAPHGVVPRTADDAAASYGKTQFPIEGGSSADFSLPAPVSADELLSMVN